MHTVLYDICIERNIFKLVISVLPFGDSSPGLSLTKPKPSWALRSGLGLGFGKPELAEAQAKLGPAHHYLQVENLVPFGKQCGTELNFKWPLDLRHLSYKFGLIFWP